MPRFECDLAAPAQPLAHVWSHTVGSGHALLGLRADWQAQMARARRELGIRHVRFHGLLDDDMAVLLTEQDQPVLGFRNVDAVYDFLLDIGVRPFVELSFMPSRLASGGQTVFNYRGNVTPPRDMNEWCGLIEALVRHWLARYGAQELRRWYFEVWNEPNLGAFWTGSRDDYFELYRRTAQTLKAADAGLRVGGPATASNAWIEEFMAFCRGGQVPCDFISTHHYPTDALGHPGDDTEAQLAQAQPGALLRNVRDTCAKAAGLPVVYTEWCASSNPFFHRHDEPYAAAFLVKNMLDVAGLVRGYSWWTFSDIFEENYFSSQPFHGGFGLLTVHGVPKPTYRAMQLLHELGSERLPLQGEHATVSAWAVRDGRRLTLLLANHAFPSHPIATEMVQLAVAGAHALRSATLRRIDDTHANAKARWEAMGSPPDPTRDQVCELEAASVLRSEPIAARSDDGRLMLELQLPPHGVAALSLEFER
jgi:xylan 1,4-beta-xylosidase